MSINLPLNPKKHLAAMIARLERWREMKEAEPFALVRDDQDMAAIYLGLADDPESPYDVYIVQGDDTYYDLGEIWIFDRRDSMGCCVGGVGNLDDGTLGMEIFDADAE